MSLRVRALYRIDARPDGPSRARKIVARELTQLAPECVVDDVKLMVSELVTSGVVNAPSSGDTAITLDVLVDSDVRCAVKNPGEAPAAALDGSGAMRLRLVARLAERWGLEGTPTGTRIWFQTSPVRPAKA
jgi:hypothetical protein